MRYTSAAHRAAVVLGAGADAEDVVQEAFVKAFRGLRRFRQGQPFRPWLLRIVANETLNPHRAARRRADLTLRAAATTPAGTADGPEASALTSERREALLDAVRRLPDKDRLVVTCRYLLDLSEAETAQVLGWPPGSVKSRLSRALDRLKARLAQSLTERVSDG